MSNNELVEVSGWVALLLLLSDGKKTLNFEEISNNELIKASD